MPPRKRKRKAAAADSADERQKAIHIQASATVHQAEDSHVTGAEINAPNAQTIHVGDGVAGDQHNVTTSSGDYAGRDIDKRQGVFVEGSTVHGDVIGQQFVTQYQQPTPIDPQFAAEHLAALPLDTIPDLAALPPGSRMPLARNPLFVGREADLMQLARALKAGGTAAIGQIAAATGLGGIGKTNLASEFVHRYGQYFAGGVFWLSFADAAAVPAEIAACGVGLDLPGFADLKLDDQVARVRHLWQAPIPRLLIFDNCEDEGLLETWRPTTGGCRVLVTSRRAAWDAALGVSALALDVLPRTESIALLRRFRPDLASDDRDLDTIAAELGDLPLALHLAGSFLKRYHADLLPADYLAELQSAAVLEHESLQGSEWDISPTKHGLHVGQSFTVSYARLRPDDAVDAVAIALLARAAYLAPGEAIPRDLLLATIEAPDTATQRQASKAISRLVALGLLMTGVGDALTLHRLLGVFVQAVVQDADAQAAVEHGIFVEVNRLNKQGLPAPLLAVQGHLRFVTDRAIVRDDERAARLCNELGSYLRMIGEYHGAQLHVERALAINKKMLGEEHPSTATSLNNLSYLLRAQGDLEGARPYYEQVLSIRRKVLGEQHPSTATSLNNLGTLLRDMGDLEGARPYLEQALAMRRTVLREEHPDTATSLNNLGILLRDTGDLVGTRPYLEQALAIKQKVLGEEHPDTAASLNNLGYLLKDLGDLKGARSYMEQALAIFTKVLGKEHPWTATSLNNLGFLLKYMGDLAGARAYCNQALAIRRKVLGEQHPDIAQSLNNLGSLLKDLGDLAGARLYYEQALAINKQVLGEEHPSTATSLNNLGYLLRAQGDLEGARQSYEQALAIVRKVLGEEHLSTAAGLNNLAVLHANAGALHEAIPLMQRALSVYEAVLGSEHPDTEMMRHSLAAMEQATQRSQGSPSQTREQQIAAITEQADAAVASALAGDDIQARAALAEQLEQQAQWAEAGEAADSPYLALAAHLRGLIVWLRAGDGDEAPGGAGFLKDEG